MRVCFRCSLKNLIGLQYERLRDRDAEHLRDLEVDDQLELRGQVSDSHASAIPITLRMYGRLQTRAIVISPRRKSSRNTLTMTRDSSSSASRSLAMSMFPT